MNKKGSIQAPAGLSVARRSSHYFISTSVASLIWILVLPLATKRLGPSDYGVYALITSYMGVGSMVAMGAITYVIPGRLPGLKKSDGAALISNAIALAVLLALAFAVVLVLLAFSPLADLLLQDIPHLALWLGLGSMVLFAPWSVISEVLILRGQSRALAVWTIAAPIMGTFILLLSLFAFDAGMFSLFLSGIASSFTFLVGGLIAVRHDLAWVLSIERMISLLKYAPAVYAAGAAESASRVVERAVLSRYVGLDQLGLYAHSQTYRNTVKQASSAVAKGVWPESLAEARDPDSSFTRVARAWVPIYASIALLGLFFASFGEPLINALTNGKFGPAYKLAALWFVWLLVVQSGRNAATTLFAYHKGSFMAKINTVCFSIGAITMVLLVPALGFYGSFIASVLQYILIRMSYDWAARRCRDVPFQDWLPIYGSILILASVGTSVTLPHGILLRLVSFLFFTSALLAPIVKVLIAETAELWRQFSSHRSDRRALAQDIH